MPLQATPCPPFSLQKFLNKVGLLAVCMNEGKRVVAGGAILSGTATIDNAERGRAESIEQVIEALVREHSRLVYRIAFAVLRSHHDAEDSTQETFLRVLRYRARLAGVDDAKPWLARIAWRVAVERSKKRGRANEIPLEDPHRPVEETASRDIPPDVKVQGSQFTAALDKLITALPEKLRQPLILSTIEEMSPREIAAALGVNEAAVRSRVFRARQILKEKLTQWASTR